jgi:hypothetical protein
MQALLNLALAYSETGTVSTINTSTTEQIRRGVDVSQANICPVRACSVLPQSIWIEGD